MQRQPDGRLVRGRPKYPMPCMGRDVQTISRFHRDRRLTVNLKPRCTLEHDNPFMLILVVPKVIGRGVTMGQNPLQTKVGGGNEGLDKLLRQVRRQVSEKVRERIHAKKTKFRWRAERRKPP